MRLRGRTLATPVRWYRHGETRATLVLVLNNHIGSRRYFAVMRQRIAELEDLGSAVYLEGICPAPAGDWLMASPAEEAARDVLLGLYRDRPAAMAAGLGWVFQGEAIGGSTWKVTDLTDLELIRLAGPEPIMAAGAAAAQASAQLGSHEDRYMRAVAPVIYRRLARRHSRWMTRLTGRLAPDLYAVLLGQRSQLAVDAIDPARDGVAVWGAEHAATLDAALAAAGWRFTGRVQWLNVGRLPPLWRTAADVVAVAWAIGRERAADAEKARESRIANRVPV
jgi:hypothetical protein